MLIASALIPKPSPAFFIWGSSGRKSLDILDIGGLSAALLSVASNSVTFQGLREETGFSSIGLSAACKGIQLFKEGDISQSLAVFRLAR